MSENKSLRMIFAGGGTGGHLFPAIAIADRLKELLMEQTSINIIFVGTKRGIEYRLKDNLGYALHLINIRGIARSLTLKNLLVPFVVVGALIKSWMLMKSFRPHLVVCTGGYVCWPVGKTAGWKNIPLVLQEQNSFPGVTTRQLAPKAKRIYLGFERAKELLHTEATMITSGNPVRSDISKGNRIKACEKYKLDPYKKTILILGGSQGARPINRAILNSISEEKLNDKYQILWQTGKREYTDVSAEIGARVPSGALFPFAEDMAEIYSAADIVIARAGALTLAELTACALPSILIPFPHAAGDHQRKNALDYTERNMALMIEETELEQKDLINEVIALFESDQYESMKAALEHERTSRRRAVDTIAYDILELLKENGDLN